MAAAAGIALNSAGAASTISPATPCIGAVAPHTYQHVILIMEENHSYKQVIGPAKYQTALAGRCGLASNHYAITYPSLPNYVALTSGAVPSNIAGRDCTPSGGCVTESLDLHPVGLVEGVRRVDAQAVQPPEHAGRSVRAAPHGRPILLRGGGVCAEGRAAGHAVVGSAAR